MLVQGWPCIGDLAGRRNVRFEVNHHAGSRHGERRDDFVLYLDRAVAPPIYNGRPEPLVIEKPVVEIVGSLAEQYAARIKKGVVGSTGMARATMPTTRKITPKVMNAYFFILATAANRPAVNARMRALAHRAARETAGQGATP
jgi:hypothetical protein